ncbi:MAG: hypothetical protein MI867_18290, partial [Pseudomonadales bacterium]|nr:hypothetical protein [Pseudomonadales bacterium]
QHTHCDYVLNSNLEVVTQYGENNRNLSTNYRYDALNRLENEIRNIQHRVNESSVPAEVKTEYSYDANNNLTSVTDPENLTTNYWINGFGERIRTNSPDTLTTDYWYDSQGNLTDKRDARGSLVKYNYDLLGRLKQVQYLGDTSQNIEYFYDEVSASNPYALGRLTRITDASGSTQFYYDHRGNTVEERRTIGGQTYTTKYAFNTADNLTQITYPSGRLVNYLRNDPLGRVTSVTTQKDENASAQTVASAFSYLPFGPLTEFEYGNGLIRQVPFDQDYRISKISVNNFMQLDLGYDWFDNINSITDSINTSNSQTFTYDDLHRLQDAYGNYSNNTDHIYYEYDLVGNRTLRKLSNNLVTHT